MRRRAVVKTTAGVGAALLAGCAGDGGGSATGTFRLMISDQPVAIDEFDSLDVTLSGARVFRAGEDEDVTPRVVNGTENETDTSTSDDTTDGENATDGDAEDSEDSEDGDGAGFVEFDLDSVTVDLTQVKGDRAVSVLEGELDEGRYSGIELRVADAEGVVDGEAVGVMVPSGRLRIIKPFEVGGGEELDFVFDITVIQKGPGGSYNLLPVIGESGVAGDDVDVEEVDVEASGSQNGTNATDEGE